MAAFSMTDRPTILLACLGLHREDFDRFRSAGLVSDYIWVETRCGGDNRQLCASALQRLTTHPCWDGIEDDEEDSTYATCWFRFPSAYQDALVQITHHPDDATAWQHLADRIMLS
ncbi:hypothetical protein SAMN00768000_0274 [Sulfobacillus thermosulfidooxidans DSM 9293]|uniref:Uncharacterized protein n=1 Tax=Sulfobacillus thermosulfidooxidans (strain DSM 9293 / VKM B-1269 / AT-1) TaxID=929705 RepID=A0A1W1W8I4_SULTA|nr:hypothetical protein [Sulfobacillus thermosulfidooxidans]SMC02063.1 hypothetical protein SAMN00768000_0274 [Sulfobacillus thermosulfidooxidans DSM 9293]